MTETQVQGHGAEQAAAGGQGEDPFLHIRDTVLFGVSTDGRLVWSPYGGHGGAHGATSRGYQPAMVGPVKLEFTKHMANEALVAAVLFVAVMAAVRRVLVDHGVERAPRGGLANAVEAMVMFVRDELVVPMGGHHVAHYTPIFLTYFFFILACNLAGLVPAAGTATGNATIALLLGSSVLVLLTGLGMVHQGPVAYFLHLVPAGTPWALWPLMLVLELVGSVIKCFVLSVRLFANMIAGHLVVGNILSLGVIGGKLATGLAVGMIFIAVPLAIGVAVLEVLVCLIQAYVFTMLAIMFVGAAVHPEH